MDWLMSNEGVMFTLIVLSGGLIFSAIAKLLKWW